MNGRSPGVEASTSQSPKRTVPGASSVTGSGVGQAPAVEPDPAVLDHRPQPVADVERTRCHRGRRAPAARPSARARRRAAAARAARAPAAARRSPRGRLSPAAARRAPRPRRAAAARLGDRPLSAPGAIRSSSGSRSWRTRVNLGSAFVGSSRQASPCSRQYASVSARVIPSNGRISRPAGAPCRASPSARATSKGASAPSRPGRRACGRSRSRRSACSRRARTGLRWRAPEVALLKPDPLHDHVGNSSRQNASSSSADSLNP